LGVIEGVTAAVLNRAQATLERWRRRIAAWSEHAPVLMPREVVTRCVAAVDDNLDVSSLIRTLIDLADDAVRPGYQVRGLSVLRPVLAFDLPRHLGAARQADASARYDR
jgi:hypothetical protein